MVLLKTGGRQIAHIFLTMFFMLPSFAHAGRYYDESEKATLSIPDCDTANIPDCKTYYIDIANGNDAWNGLSPAYTSGSNGPYKTIGKATDRYGGRNKAGNTFKIKAGIYREKISFGNPAGTFNEAHRLTIGPFGNGEVIVDASSTHQLVWTKSVSNGQIYETPCDFLLGGTTHVSPAAVIMDDNYRAGRAVYSLAEVNMFGQWYYDGTAKKLYVHTNGEDPLLHDIIVIKTDVDNVEYGIYAINNNYLTVYGLTVRGAGSYGIWANGSHVRLEKNTFKFSGKAGLKAEGPYDELYKNHVYGNVMLNWPRGLHWGSTGGWPNGFTFGGYAKVSGNVVHDNGGEGIGSMGGTGNAIIEDNISYDNWSVNMYLDNQPAQTVRRNLLYNHPIRYEDVIDVLHVPVGSTLQSIYKRMTPEGIMTGDEIATNPVAQSMDHRIYNNIIIGCRSGWSHYGQAAGPAMRNFMFANNTIIMPAEASDYGNWVGIAIPGYGGTKIANNIIYNSRVDSPLLSLYQASMPADVTLDNNVYHNPNNPTPFWTGSYPNTAKYDFAGWKNSTLRDANSTFADPLFVGGANAFDFSYYYPTSTSPTIGAGVTLQGFSYDFNNNIRPDIWTIGALEYTAISTTTTTIHSTERLFLRATPNPINPVTTIRFSLPEHEYVTLEAFDVQGNKAATVIERKFFTAGPHSIDFNTAGKATGVYVCRLKAGKSSCTAKIDVVR